MLETVMMVVVMMVTMIERCLRGRASSHMARGPVVVTITSVGGGFVRCGKEVVPRLGPPGITFKLERSREKKRFVMMKIYRSGSLFLYNTNLI